MQHVAEIRQCGFIAGIELKQDGKIPFDPKAQTGGRVCLAARKHGLLTRPVRDTIVLMPPYCITEAQLKQAVNAICSAITEVCG
jgi:adenosylmethionine-8-amino-7-oxononanoate aminotransferase